MSKTKNPSPSKKEKQTREPKDPNLRCKAYKFRLYPTKKLVDKLTWMLRRCKELYNAALQEHRDTYRMCGVSISYRMQAEQLPAIKKLREEYQDIHSQVLQDVLRRLDKAFAAFFRRVMNGEPPGYPRYKGGDRYHSITYPQGGFEILHGNRLHLSKIGHIKNLTATPKPKQDEATGKYLPNGAAAKAGLNTSILDAGWGEFVRLCSSKAEEAGATVVKVAPHFTTQICSGCGIVVPKDLSIRWHSCPNCGVELDRDHNAARNILHRYQQKNTSGQEVSHRNRCLAQRDTHPVEAPPGALHILQK